MIRRTRSNFDWSMLDRKGIIRYVNEIYPEIAGKTLSYTSFHRIISRHIRKKFPVIVTKRLSIEQSKHELFVGGTYYRDEDKRKRRCIEVVILYNTNFSSIQLSKYRFHRIAILIADTILHEIIHMRQYRRRKFKFLPDYASTAERSSQRKEQGYLGNTDEIDAYGFNIACDLLSHFKGNEKKIADYLNSDRLRRKNSWTMYLKAFDYNHNHQIIKRLKKKIIRYLPNASLGKPYRNKEWINN